MGSSVISKQTSSLLALASALGLAVFAFSFAQGLRAFQDSSGEISLSPRMFSWLSELHLNGEKVDPSYLQVATDQLKMVASSPKKGTPNRRRKVHAKQFSAPPLVVPEDATEAERSEMLSAFRSTRLAYRVALSELDAPILSASTAPAPSESALREENDLFAATLPEVPAQPALVENEVQLVDSLQESLGASSVVTLGVNTQPEQAAVSDRLSIQEPSDTAAVEILTTPGNVGTSAAAAKQVAPENQVEQYAAVMSDTSKTKIVPTIQPLKPAIIKKGPEVALGTVSVPAEILSSHVNSQSFEYSESSDQSLDIQILSTHSEVQMNTQKQEPSSGKFPEARLAMNTQSVSRPMTDLSEKELTFGFPGGQGSVKASKDARILVQIPQSIKVQQETKVISDQNKTATASFSAPQGEVFGPPDTAFLAEALTNAATHAIENQSVSRSSVPLEQRRLGEAFGASDHTMVEGGFEVVSDDGDAKSVSAPKWVVARPQDSAYLPTLFRFDPKSEDSLVPVFSRNNLAALSAFRSTKASPHSGVIFGYLPPYASVELAQDTGAPSRSEVPLYFLTDEMGQLVRDSTGSFVEVPEGSELARPRAFILLNIPPGVHLLYANLFGQDLQPRDYGAIDAVVKADTPVFVDLREVRRVTLSGAVLDGDSKEENPIPNSWVSVVGQNRGISSEKGDGEDELGGTFEIKDVLVFGTYPLYVETALAPTGVIHRYKVPQERADSLVLYRYHSREKLADFNYQTGHIVASLPLNPLIRKQGPFSVSSHSVFEATDGEIYAREFSSSNLINTLDSINHKRTGTPVLDPDWPHFVMSRVSSASATAPGARVIEVRNKQGDVVLSDLVVSSPGVIQVIGL